MTWFVERKKRKQTSKWVYEGENDHRDAAIRLAENEKRIYPGYDWSIVQGNVYRTRSGRDRKYKNEYSRVVITEHAQF